MNVFTQALKWALRGWRGKPVSTLFEMLFFFLQWGAATGRCWNNGGHRERGGNSGGLLLVPDVLVRQHGGEGLVTEVCSEPPSSRLHCEASNHICFYSKQSGAGTAGSLSLLLKAFWGLLRDGPDGVIYPLFAEWTRIECDVYGHGIPISHPCQDTYPEGLMNLGCLLQQDETVPHILDFTKKGCICRLVSVLTQSVLYHSNPMTRRLRQ